MNKKKLLNPFFYAKKAAGLLWSLGIPITKNDFKIKSLKNKHLGRRCFIIGSGPSLKVEDLDKLKNEVTFACNKIYLAFESTDWRPTYYSVYDVLVAENNKQEIQSLNSFKIFGESVKPYFDVDSAIWIKELGQPCINDEYTCNFSENCLVGANGGWTVIYLQMQLAYYMGIREIYLLGLDFKFDVPEATGKNCISGAILRHQGEINHFHPDYRKPNETWTMPLLELQYKAFAEAKFRFEKHGGMIFNASRKTALDLFPLVNIDHVLSEAK